MPALPASLESLLTTLSGWPRRAAAVLCLLAAIGSALIGGRPRAGPTQSIVVASRQLAAGSTLTALDLTLSAWPPSSTPMGSVHATAAVVGRRVAGKLGRGMPITADSLLETAVASALSDGLVASTVELASVSQLAMLRVGDHVDLYPASDGGGAIDPRPSLTATPVARGAEVLSVLAPSSAGPDTKPALVIATERSSAGQIATQFSGSFLATLVQPP